ncbi:metal-sensitive transcriptional regulator [Arthrobacter sp. B1805]|uniref:metal-sensitive transcriptional regulator n=1 Tax=Arthrobacter sp. B1805 TaxID=2058892 RepID=UPI000CE4087F|nr:metal-sensitive transcriptional regulator [Arthrobacter sp. B1805]
MTVSSGTGTHASTATSHEAVSAAAGESTKPDVSQNQKVTGRTAHGYAANKNAYLRRLKRIEGQVRGIARMVDEDKYCIDILTQVAAVNSAMHAVSLGLLENHLQHCVVDAAHEAATSGSSDAIDAKVKEATQAISRLLR